ncbi:MAG: hypothetical protein ACMXYE_04900 [Candidatus Woesearchaeota archaeon]
MSYKPHYAEGQILVGFKGRITSSSAEYIGNQLGYKLHGEYPGHNTFAFTVSPGSEQKAIDDFTAHESFVEWADRRDILYDARAKALERVIAEVTALRDTCELDSSSLKERKESLTLLINQIPESLEP